jgi:uncharacterized Zn finger protein (UPF0148 family)
MKNLKNFIEYIAEKSNKCDNCGAPLSSKDIVCKYCGVEHDKEFQKTKKEIEMTNSKSSVSKADRLKKDR